MKIEEKKQQKLEFPAEMFDEGGQHVEAHITRSIIKPTIADMNTRWTQVSAFDKVKALENIRQNILGEKKNHIDFKKFSELRNWINILKDENDRIVDEIDRILVDNFVIDEYRIIDDNTKIIYENIRIINKTNELIDNEWDSYWVNERKRRIKEVFT